MGTMNRGISIGGYIKTGTMVRGSNGELCPRGLFVSEEYYKDLSKD